MDESMKEQAIENEAPHLSDEFRQELERGDSQFERGRYRAAAQIWRETLEAGERL